jgi:pimeloyl-ACP methyl ester carboxylesterase
LTGKYAHVGNLQLHYVDSGSGPLVFFLHGFPEFWYSWRHQLKALSSSYHAVAVDMRGYNLSSKPESPKSYRASEVAEDIIALADRLGAEKFSVVGHDWGGVIAWRIANRFPDRLEKLVIINAPHPAIMRRELLHNPKQLLASSYILFLRLPGSERMLRAFDFRLLRPILDRGLEKGYFTQQDVDAYVAAWSQPGALRGSVAYYKAIDILPALRKRGEIDERPISVPTLVIWGERDRNLLPGNLDGLDVFVDNLKVHRVPDASHWIVQEQPEMINRLLLDFLTSHDARDLEVVPSIPGPDQLGDRRL